MPRSRAVGLVATAVVASLMSVSGEGASLAQHLGAINPTTEGFAQYSTISATGPVVNDAGFDAWQVTGTGCCSFFGQSVNYATAFSQGWRLTARMRVVSGTGWAFVGLNPFSDHLRFDFGVRVVGSNAEIGLFDTITTTPQTYTLAGSANAWLLLELVYDPGTRLATLYVNGIERLTGYAGFAQFVEGRGVLFGANGATANFNLVKFEVPATAANPTAPTTSYAAWRTGAPPALTTFDFEAFATGTQLAGNEYAGLGLTLVQRDGDPMRIASPGDGSFTSTANVRSPSHVLSSSAIPGFAFGYDDSRSEHYDFVFATPQRAVGLWIGNLNPGFNTVSVEFLDANDVVLAIQPLNTLDLNLIVGSGQFDNRLFAGINSPTPVKRIRVNNADGDQDGIVFDDVVFGGPAPTVSLDKTKLTFGAVTSGQSFLFQTAAQVVRLTQTGGGSVTWTAASNQPWLQVSPSTGTGSSSLSISVRPATGLPPAGTLTGAITFTFVGASNTAGPVTVKLNLLSGTSAEPFGFVDTPFEGRTGVTGAVPFTGWMLDDVEGVRVMICRAAVGSEVAPVDANCAGMRQIFVGFPVFIDVARPDVEMAYPEIPLNSRAGWGLMVLTNMLPSQGNGTFLFYIWGQDREGNTKLLGTRTITCDNLHATKPFGAIDTPTQGGLASGTSFVNFGWVLTPSPKAVPTDGSTISVLVDGVAVGTASYNHFRADIATLFPGLSNTNGAVGFRIIDTTPLTNGTHTIVWVVTDDQGVTEGIGSRFFNVSNGVGALTASIDDTLSSERPLSAAVTAPVDFLPRDTSLVLGRQGWDLDASYRLLPEDDLDRLVVRSEEVNRIELQLGPGEYTGHLRAGRALRPLPTGSRLDAATGEFTWAPGPGFVGPYDLVFVRHVNGRAVARREVRIVLLPKDRKTAGPQVVIDAPAARRVVSQPFALAGWAVDLDSPSGTGIAAPHVWAYPLAGGRPVFLGTAKYGGARADVEALHGEEFRDAGFDLVVQGLAPGTYDLAVFAWSMSRADFLPARTVRVTVR